MCFLDNHPCSLIGNRKILTPFLWTGLQDD
jgi:hypothetical protein